MIVLSTAYLPPVSWFQSIGKSETFALEAHENYQKGSWRNRCHIAGPNGIQRLSIPLEKGKHQQTPIRDVRISYADNWQLVHWRSIKTAYGSAPFFEHYADELAHFYEKKEIYLFDFNHRLIEFLFKKTGLKPTISFTDTYTAPLTAFSASIKPYAQVFEDRHGFLPDLSLLDALMCCGKQLTGIITL